MLQKPTSPLRPRGPLAFYHPELDSLRFVAFLLVFIHHAAPLNHPALRFIHSFGWIGVDLFFALSAYLFVKLLAKEFNHTGTLCIWKFYIRRLLRIWPVYMFFCTLMVSRSIYSGELASPWRALGLFTFTDNILAAFKGYNPIPYASHLWTISYEEHFYLFIPLLLFLIFNSTTKRVVVTLSALAIIFALLRAIFIWMGAPHPAIWVLPITHFESILLGIIVGLGGFDIMLARVPAYALLLTVLLSGWLITQLGSIESVGWHLMPSYLLIGLCTSLTLYLVTRIAKSKWMQWLYYPPFVELGKIYYGLYVYHLVGLKVGQEIVQRSNLNGLNPINNVAIMNLVSLLATITIAGFSYRFLEKPFLRIKKRFEVIPSRPP